MATATQDQHYARTRAATILLRSSDGTFDSVRGSYSYQLPTPLVANPDELITCEVHSAAIPNSFYNTEQGRNIFNVTETISGTTATRTITVAPGNYDVRTLRTALLAGLNGGTPVYTSAFSKVTGKFTFSVTGATAVSFDMTSPGIRRSMGFTKAIHNFAGSPLSLTSDQVVDMSSNNHNILIEASFLSNSFISSRTMRPTGILATVPISVPNFQIIFYSNETEYAVLLRNSIIDQFSISLSNQDGNQLNFNGVEFEISLRFRFEKVNEFETTSLSLSRRMIQLKGNQLKNQLELIRLQQEMANREVQSRSRRVKKRARELENS